MRTSIECALADLENTPDGSISAGSPHFETLVELASQSLQILDLSHQQLHQYILKGAVGNEALARIAELPEVSEELEVVQGLKELFQQLRNVPLSQEAHTVLDKFFDTYLGRTL